MLKKIIYKIYLFFASLCSAVYGPEGLNLILKSAPTGVIISLLNKYGAKVHPTARIKAPLIIHNASFKSHGYFENLTIEQHVFIGREGFFDLEDTIIIKKEACLSHGIKIMTHTDAGDAWVAKQKIIEPSHGSVCIQEGVYIGAYTVILQNVTIGKGAVIGANSLVNKNCHSMHLYAGSPAKAIKPLSR